MASNISFTAHVIGGSGRGKGLGVPTLNLALEDVPKELEEGIYAVWVKAALPRGAASALRGVMHYGPRPVFDDSKSCEIHMLSPLPAPSSQLPALHVEIVERIRDVQDFADAESLKREMAEDIRKAKRILELLSNR